MAGETQDTSWPRPTFQFSVEISGVEARVLFTEVTGLDPIKRSAPRKYGSITLERGLFTRDSRLIDWLRGINRNDARPSTVTIRLLDERGNSAMAWVLTNARPAKVVGADLDAKGTDVAVEALELSHEGIAIANP